MNNLTSVVKALREFAAERDWSQFHDPKNLAMAVSAVAIVLVVSRSCLDRTSITPATRQPATRFCRRQMSTKGHWLCRPRFFAGRLDQT